MKDFFQRAKTLHPIRDLDNSKVGPENEHLIGGCPKDGFLFNWNPVSIYELEN